MRDGPRFGQFDHHGKSVAAAIHRAAGHVVDVQHPARRLRGDALFMQSEHRSLSNDEQAAQLGEPGDDVARQSTSGTTRSACRLGQIDERHHRDRPATRRRGHTVAAIITRRYSFVWNHRRHTRWALDLCLRGPPCVAERRAVETLRLEQPNGCREMFLAFTDLAVSGERAQQQLMHTLVKRRQDQPFLQIRQDLGRLEQS